MSENLSEAAKRAMVILKATYIPGLSERYAETDDGYFVLKEHMQDEQFYWDDYKLFRKNPHSIRYPRSILTVIQNNLIRIIPGYRANEFLAPLILKFLNKEYPYVKKYSDEQIRYAYEIYETCVAIERENYLRKCHKNDYNDSNNI